MPTRGPPHLARTHRHPHLDLLLLHHLLIILLPPRPTHPTLLPSNPSPPLHSHRTRLELDLHPPLERDVEWSSSEGVFTYETGGDDGRCVGWVGGQGVSRSLGRGCMGWVEVWVVWVLRGGMWMRWGCRGCTCYYGIHVSPSLHLSHMILVTHLKHAIFTSLVK
jgi:hypothetical protein